MPRFRALAEFRRAHREDPWRLTGVEVEGRWVPLRAGVRTARWRLVEADLLRRVTLPPIVAGTEAQAVEVAVDLAADRVP